MATTTQQLRANLSKFYQKPVARVSVELILSIGAVMFFAFFAIRPTLVTMSELVKEIEEKRALDRQLEQKIAALSTLQNEYLIVQERLSVLDQAIPSNPEIEQALKIIEKIASDNQLVISSMQLQELPQDTDESVPFEQRERVSLPVSVNVTGSYDSIRSFIEALQNNRRALIVDSITLSVTQERQERNLRAVITVNLQYFGAKTTTAKAGTTQQSNSNSGTESEGIE